MNFLENTQILKKITDTFFLRILKETDLTINEIKVLLFLYRNKKSDIASHIVEKLKISKSHVSLSVESLYNKKYIERVHDNHDKKKIHLKLTNKSNEIIELIENNQEELKNILFQNINEKQRKEFKETFEKILENAKTVI